jgi:hypothetical protein
VIPGLTAAITGFTVDTTYQEDDEEHKKSVKPFVKDAKAAGRRVTTESFHRQTETVLSLYRRIQGDDKRRKLNTVKDDDNDEVNKHTEIVVPDVKTIRDGINTTADPRRRLLLVGPKSPLNKQYRSRVHHDNRGALPGNEPDEHGM